MRVVTQLLLLICLVMSLFVRAYAQTKMDYFSAKVPVKTQTAQERRSAARNALLQVLLRMSGSEQTVEDIRIREQARKALSYVEQFQYQPLKDESLLELGYRELVSLTFSGEVVKKILADAQQPFWSASRPSTLVWLVEDSPEYGKQLINQQSDVEILQALDKAAEQRGLPLSFPLLDLDDQLALSAEDVWDINEEAIREASKRYSADTILVGRYSKTSRGRVLASWQFFHGDTARSYDSRVALDENGHLDPVIGVEALYPLADFLAKRYANQPQLEAGGRLVVQVSDIDNFAQYRRSLSYLGGLAAVSKVQIVAVRQDTLLLFLESQAGVERFVSILNLDNKLRIKPDNNDLLPAWQRAPQGTLENPLKFSWSS
ncbi:DUF2066 domain-containing protein [Agarilytica rhodophyticola]|uniref:DUF2066 domain-containing protein n=1 Tax=Agarilytica rhodophyticola TaxID=1737490 RepID=UPI000B34141B|nr:DUF2066 domain-containing protein [Agarilytica rhodophyticola]